MIFNDFDIWEQAFKDMKLNESVSFVSRGRLITEASQVEMFNKINALLNCDGMECSHKWLYSLDPTELSESETSKVNNLWKLGCERGMIECSEDEAEEKEEKEANEDEVIAAVEPAPVAPAPTPSVPQSAYTILYSAMRNGEIKTGEAYSNSLNPRSAKADVIGLLERAGYSNIKILAIECGDPDECGNDCNNTYCKQADMTPIAPQTDAIPDYSIDNESVAGAIGGAIKGAVGGAAAGAIFDAEQELTDNEVKAEVKKAFDEVNKELGNDVIEQDKARKWLDDNKKTLDKIRATLKPEDAKKLDIITQTLEAYSNGKLAEAEDEELDEAKGGKKPSSGISTVIRGLFKILCTLVSLVGSGIGFSGKLVVWVGKLLSTGADKLNIQLKDSEDENVNEAGEDEEKADDASKDDDGKEDDEKEEDSSDAEDDSDNNDDKEDDEDSSKKEEKAEEPDEKLKDDADDKAEKASDKEKEDKKLDASEKTALKDSYKKAFKAAMQKCKFFDKSFDDLSLEEKVEFFTALAKSWTKADPSKFMNDKELQQLQSIIVKK